MSEGILTAMVPATNLGLTLDARPTFWLYVPFGGGELELILFDLLCHRDRNSDFLSVNSVVQRTCLVETEAGTLQRATPADDCTTEAIGDRDRARN